MLRGCRRLVLGALLECQPYKAPGTWEESLVLNGDPILVYALFLLSDLVFRPEIFVF